MPAFPDVTVLLGDPTLPDASKYESRYREEDLECVRRLRAALGALERDGYRFRYLDRHEDLVQELVAEPPAFVLNFCDTGYRNRARQEPHLPALLELLDVPCSGADPACMTLCYDKAAVRCIAASLGVAVPEERFVRADAVRSTLPERYPALIKPNRADGSVGLTKEALVRDDAQARAYLDRLAGWLPQQDVLIQEYLPGPEYGVGVIGNPGGGLRLLPYLEVDFSGLGPDLPPLLSFESKAVPGTPYWTEIRFHEARLDGAARRELERTVTLLYERLGLRDYGRFDFRTDAAGVVKLMEVNPNPAWSHDGKLAFMAGFAGIDHPGMLRLILEAAQERAAAEAVGRSPAPASPPSS